MSMTRHAKIYWTGFAVIIALLVVAPLVLPEGPPVLTICQRHLAAGHVIRRKTTPTDLRPHTTACVR